MLFATLPHGLVVQIQHIADIVSQCGLSFKVCSFSCVVLSGFNRVHLLW